MNSREFLAQLINTAQWDSLDYQQLDSDQLDLTAVKSEGVLEMLAARYAQNGSPAWLDKLLGTQPGVELAHYLRHCVATDIQRTTHLADIIETLKPWNPIGLKGIVLAHGYYEHPYTRPMEDIDVLVSPHHAEAVKSALSAAGCTLLPSNHGNVVLTQFCFSRKVPGGQTLLMDVHTRLFNRPGLQDLLDYQALHKQAVCCPVGEQQILMPCAAHGVIHACIHMMAHHENSRRLVWLYDIQLLVNSLGTDRTTQLVEFSQHHGLAQILLAALRPANALFPFVDSSLIEQLEIQDTKGATMHPSTSFLQNSGNVRSTVADFLQTPGWRRKVAFLREHLFPAQAYMKKRYPGHSGVTLWLLYIWRILRGTVRLVFHKI